MSVARETPSGWQFVFIRVYNSLVTEISRKSTAIRNLGKAIFCMWDFVWKKETAPSQELLKKVHNRQIVLFGTCGFGQSQEYYDRIVENVKQWIPKDNSCLGAFLCMGKMPMQVRKRYEVMEENPEQREKAQMLIRNFDKALLHPDDADIQNAVAFAREAWKKAESCTDM